MACYSTKCMTVVFPSVLNMKDEPMVEMFKILEDTGLKFLGCTYSILKPILDEFFSSATMDHGTIICTIQGQNFKISQRIFAEVFYLSGVGVISCKDLSPAYVET